MVLTPEQVNELLEAAKPLIKWLNENCYPHCTAVVDTTDVFITEGVCRVGTEEYLRG